MFFLFLKKIKLQWIQFFLETRICFWIAQKCIWILVEKSAFFCAIARKIYCSSFKQNKIYFHFFAFFLPFYPTKNNNNKFHICIKWLYLKYIKHLFLLLCLFKTKIAHNWNFTKKEKPNEESFFTLMLMKRAS